MLQIYIGDGKGKTTAAVGLSIRCAGSGKRVLFTQLLKDNTSSEINVLKNVTGIEFLANTPIEKFYFLMSEEEKLETQRIMLDSLSNVIEEVIREPYDMLVIDEALTAYQLGLLNKERFLTFLVDKKDEIEIILTGREAPEELIVLADYVSEIKKIKHPYDHKLPARKGIEY